MWNELVNVIRFNKVEEEDKKHAKLLLSLLNTASGSHLMKKEITHFLEDMVEKYGEIPTKATLEQQLIELKNDYEEYKKKPIKGIDKLDGFHWVNVNDKICADYELKIKNLESEIARYNKGV
jgi:hypothetical protein